MKIWAIERLDEGGEWVFVDYERTRGDARAELWVYRAMYKQDRFRVRAYQRIEASR